MGEYKALFTIKMNHLRELEAEAIYIIREVAAQFERPVILFSGGKDSIVVVHLAYKAFWPAPLPFPLLHIDTGHNFHETIEYRDALVKKTGVRLIVGSVQETIDNGKVKEETGYNASRNVLQTVTLLETIEEYKIDAAIGGGRRDEEKARARNAFFHIAMSLANGIQKINDPSFGISSMGKNIWVNISGFSPSAIGLNWMCGSIFITRE